MPQEHGGITIFNQTPVDIPEPWSTAEANEGAWRRVIRDTRACATGTLWGVATLVLAAAAAIATTTPYLSNTHPSLVKAVVAGSAVIIGFLVGVAVLCAVVAARTPYRQRNEARYQRDQSVQQVRDDAQEKIQRAWEATRDWKRVFEEETEKWKTQAQELKTRLAGQTQQAEHARMLRTKLGEYISLADVRLQIITEVAMGKRPERPELDTPEPSGDATIDRHHRLIYQLRVESAKHEPPWWKEGALAWATEVRQWLTENLEPSYAARFDHPVRQKPQILPPFEEPAQMLEWWQEVAIRQERLLVIMGEIQ